MVDTNTVKKKKKRGAGGEASPLQAEPVCDHLWAMD